MISLDEIQYTVTSLGATSDKQDTYIKAARPIIIHKTGANCLSNK